MKHSRRPDLARLESLLPLVAFTILGGFTYALFFHVPYAGIYFSPDGTLSRLYVTSAAPPDQTLQVGDQLIQVGSVAWADFTDDLRQPLFLGVKPGQVVPMVIQRDGNQLTISWTFPGPTAKEIWERLYSEWPLAYVFWLAGTATLLFLRPKDERWKLLIAFNYLTALWLAVGGTLSPWHVWEGAIILRAAVWLSVPVYLHLHWVFPGPLKRLPSFFWYGLYLAGIGLAGLELFQRMPARLYFFGFLLALAGSVGLMLAHYIFRAEQRRDIGRLVFLWTVALLPPILVSLIGTLSDVPTFSGGALIALPVLPIAYLYTAYHRQLIRANRLIALYLFIILLVTTLAVLIPLTETLLPGNTALIEFVTPILAVLIAILSFGHFQRWVDRHLLGAPWPLTQLLETYAARITTSLDTPRLAKMLSEEVLPSLLIRQSTLLHYEADQLTTIYVQALETSQLPNHSDFPSLVAQAGKYRSPAENPFLYPWVRLILPLSVESKVIGLWLLGRRDPDDFYAQTEISLLQTLAHQTAIALTNIAYAGRLHALYQTSIDQREAERASLGRELHDHVLQQMFLLQESAVDCLDSPPFVKAYETVINDLRDLIRGLRPPMLEYGLYRALAALADDWAYRSDAQSGPEISLTLTESDLRYVPHIELHLYRIVQQAGENALRHARAQNIKIQGCLQAEHVELSVEDDGLGFQAEKLLDLSRPEARSHFGLIGMQERAALIQAQIRFDSATGQGTRIQLRWRVDD